MFSLDFGFILLYLAAFGLSDNFVKIMNLNGYYLFLYYILIGFIGFYIVCSYNYVNKIEKKSKH